MLTHFLFRINFGIQQQTIKVVTQGEIAKVLSELSKNEIGLANSTNDMHATVIARDAGEMTDEDDLEDNEVEV